METGEIERQYFQRREINVEKIKIQEIHNLSEAQAVEQIPNCPTQYHAQPNSQPSPFALYLKEEPGSYDKCQN